MADETKSYKIEYSAPPAKILADLAKIDAALAKTQAGIAKTSAMLKVLGQSSPGLKQYINELKKLDIELLKKVADAGSAQNALKKVGSDNRAVTSLTARLKELEAELARVIAASAAATTGLAGVGKGASLPKSGKPGAAGAGMGVGTIAQHAAFMAFRRGVSAVGEASKDSKQFFKDSADLTSDYRKDLLELAILKGKSSDDNAFLREDLQFQKDTLLNPEESKTFRLEFGGAVDASLKANKGRNLSPATAAALEKEAASYTARYRLDPTTGGRMAGLLGTNQHIPDAATGVGIMAESMEQLNLAGVGAVRQLAPQMFRLRGAMLGSVNDDSEGGEAGGGGRFKGDVDLAARFAASTINTSGNAAVAKTRIVQSDRLLRRLAYDKDSELGKKAGITPEDDYETAINKLAPHIAGKGGYQAMIESGYKNTTELNAVIEEAKLNDTVKANLADPRIKAAGRNAIAANRAHANTLVGRQQAAENAEFASTVETGILGESLKRAQAAARARMADPNQKGGQRLKAKGIGVGVDLYRDWAPGLVSGFGAEEQRVNEEAIRKLVEEGKSVGVDVEKRYPKMTVNGAVVFQPQTADELARDFGRASGEVDAARDLKIASDALARASKIIARPRPGGGGGGQPPAPARPQMNLPNGGGNNPGRP